MAAPALLDFAPSEPRLTARPRRRRGLIAALGAWLAFGWAGAGLGETLAGSAGRFELWLSSRTFDGPLFDSRTSSRWRLFADQELAERGGLTAWAESSSSSSDDHFGLKWRDLPAGEGRRAVVELGDLVVGAPLADGFGGRSRGLLLLQGGRVEVGGEGHRWQAFAGRARRLRTLPGRSDERPTLFGAAWASERGRNRLRLSVVGQRDPILLDPSETAGESVVFGGELQRRVSPRVMLLAELLASHGEGLGARAGGRFEWNTGEVEATAYRFDEQFPFLDPLYRPGETGVDLNGWLRPTEFTSLSGHVTYVATGPLRGGSEVRSNLWLSWYLGDNRPYVRLGYARSEITLDRTSIAEPGVVSDRVVLSLSKNGAHGLINVDLEHLVESGLDGGERSQIVAAFHRSWAPSTLATGTAVVQRDAGGNLGLTADGAVERPWRGPYRYLVGLGAALVDRGGSKSGEGVVRLGLARRMSTDGWIGRVELRIPFGLGLERTDLVSRQLVVDFGHRLSWSDWRSLGDGGRLPFGEPSTGRIEGSVTFAGRGVPGVTVSVDGEARTVTDRQGRFRVRRLPAGPASLAIDPRQLDTRWSVAGGAERLVSVVPGGVTRVDLQLLETSSLRGAVVVCDADDSGKRLAPLIGAIVRLSGLGDERSTTSSRLGSFQFDDLPPGPYELTVLEPAAPEGGALARLDLDLERSRSGLVVRIGCGD